MFEFWPSPASYIQAGYISLPYFPPCFVIKQVHEQNLMWLHTLFLLFHKIRSIFLIGFHMICEKWEVWTSRIRFIFNGCYFFTQRKEELEKNISLLKVEVQCHTHTETPHFSAFRFKLCLETPQCHAAQVLSPYIDSLWQPVIHMFIPA